MPSYPSILDRLLRDHPALGGDDDEPEENEEAEARPRAEPSTEVRRAVERHAMAVARKHYEDKGYVVDDVSSKEPYDLKASKGDEEVHVEVKGTRRHGSSVFVTKNEVAHARELAPPRRSALFVVSRIQIDASHGPLVGAGGQWVCVDPWRPSDTDLEGLLFSYRVPSG